MTESRVHVFTSGDVRDVHVRDNAHGTARAHGIEGWVRNLDDGRAEAVFEGSEEDVRTMLEWSERGPIWAEVADVVVEEGDFDGFEKR